jgi:hypothetical protein
MTPCQMHEVRHFTSSVELVKILAVFKDQSDAKTSIHKDYNVPIPFTNIYQKCRWHK